jgi:transposase InsO family protein
VRSTNEILHQSSPTVSVGTIPHQYQNIINVSQEELQTQIFKVEAGQKFKLNGKTYVRRIISFNSRSLKGGEKNYGISKLEGLGVVWALKKNDHFLRGAPLPIEIYTDHKALESFNSQSNNLVNNTLNTWLHTLNRYNFRITYVNGYQNVIPDYLSRRGEDEKWKEEKKISEDMLNQNITESFYSLDELSPDVKLTTIDDPLVKNNLLTKYHLKGHFGARHLVRSITNDEKVTWKSMYKDAVEHCRLCVKCAEHQIQRKGFHPLRLTRVTAPGELYMMDTAHMHSLAVEGELAYNYVLIVVDAMTRFICLEPLTDLGAKTVAQAFMKICCRIGFPSAVFMDNGTELKNETLQEVLKEVGASMNTSAPYHHRGNGMAEAAVKTVSTVLKKMLEKENREFWHNYLPFVEYFCNNRITELTNSKPFNLMFGRENNFSAQELCIPEEPMKIDDLEKRWKNIFKYVYPNIDKRVQELNKIKESKFVEQNLILNFEKGDSVMALKKEYTDKNGKPNKFEPVYEGPFIITSIKYNKRKQITNYRLKSVESDVDINRDFPVSHLKLFSKPIAILKEEKETALDSGGQPKFLVSFGNFSYWIEKDSVDPMLIKEYKERLKLEKAEMLTDEQKTKKKQKEVLSLKAQVALKLEALKKLEQELEELQAQD